MRWLVTVWNRGRETQELVFASGQRGDVVLERGGAERYRWSRGRAFAAVLEARDLTPGEAGTFELTDTLSVEPGTYVLTATLCARPEPPAFRGDVTVHSAG